MSQIRIEKITSRFDLRWNDVYRLCCITGNDGASIEPLRFRFFSLLWVGPYRWVYPTFTYLAMQGDAVIGYLTGAPSTQALRIGRFLWNLGLLVQLLCGRFVRNDDTKRFIRRFFRRECSPEDLFSSDLHTTLVHGFPAHLHINLDSKFRGNGLGIRLIEAFEQDLRAMNVSGMHVFCAAGPVSFYRKVGFSIERTVQLPKSGLTVFALTKRVDSPVVPHNSTTARVLSETHHQ